MARNLNPGYLSNRKPMRNIGMGRLPMLNGTGPDDEDPGGGSGKAPVATNEQKRDPVQTSQGKYSLADIEGMLGMQTSNIPSTNEYVSEYTGSVAGKYSLQDIERMVEGITPPEVKEETLKTPEVISPLGQLDNKAQLQQEVGAKLDALLGNGNTAQAAIGQSSLNGDMGNDAYLPDYKKAPEEYVAYINSLDDSQLMPLYTSPGYKLNKADVERAKGMIAPLMNSSSEIGRQLSEEFRLDSKETYGLPRESTLGSPLGAQAARLGTVPNFGAMNGLEDDKGAVERKSDIDNKKDVLTVKTNPFAAAANASERALMGGLGNTSKMINQITGTDTGESGRRMDVQTKNISDNAWAQHPIASFAGAAATEVAKYMGAGKIMDGVGLGVAAFGKIGKAGSDLVGKIPGIGGVASKFLTPSAVGGMARDLTLDMALDTLPRALVPGITSLVAGEKQNLDGSVTPYNLGNLAGDVGGNIAANIGFNAIGEATSQVLPLIPKLFSRVGKGTAADAAKVAVNTLDGAKAGTNAADAAKATNGAIPTLKNANAFDDGFDGAIKADMEIPQLKRMEDIADIGKPPDNPSNALDDGFGKNTVGAAESRFANQQKQSAVAKTFENTPLFSAAEKTAADLSTSNPKFEYDVVTEKQSLHTAAQRLAVDYTGEVADLPTKTSFGGEDLDTAMMIMRKEADAAKITGDWSEVERWGKIIQEKGTNAGQAVQAYAKYTRTPESMVVKGQKLVDDVWKQFSKSEPNMAKALEGLADNLADIAKTYDYSLPIEPEVALERLRKAITGVVENSKIKVDEAFIDRAAQMLIDQRKGNKSNILDMLKQVEELPVIDSDTVMKVFDIMGEAEKHGLYSKARFDLEQQAYQLIANKFNSSFMDKANAWRYLSMLGNPRTHIRNMTGNVMFGAVTRIKDNVSALIQSTVDRISKAVGGNGIQKTTSILDPLNKTDTALKKAAKADFDEVYGLVMGGGKYNPISTIEGQIPAFKTGWLEKLSRGNSKILEAEDAFASSRKYADSLARYLKANDIDATIFKATDQTSMGLLDSARIYATNEAHKATFRDASNLANILNNASRNASKGSLAGKAGHMFIEGVLPFKKTPINILKRGVEYSPVGIGIGIKQLLIDVRKGRMPVAQAIDKLSAGLTGSGIMAVGMYLSSLGILSAGKDENKREESFNSLQGAQNYALNIGGKSYTLDWAAPAALPLFIGVEIMNGIANDGEGEPVDLFNALARIGDPALEMSMLQGLNQTFSSSYGSDNAISSIATRTATNYATQFVPTALGQAARSIDPLRRSTYTDQSGVMGELGRTLNKVENRIPFLSQTNEPYIDQWGRTQENTGGNFLGRLASNTISPGFYSESRSTPVDDELSRIYKSTGDSNVLPAVADKSVKEDGETRKYTPKEYTQYATVQGQTRYEALEQLIQHPAYTNLDDAQKQSVVKDVYGLSSTIARKTVIPEYVVPSPTKKGYAAYEAGIPLPEYMIYRAYADIDGNGTVSQAETKATLDAMELTDLQRAYLYELQNSGWKTNPYR